MTVPPIISVGRDRKVGEFRKSWIVIQITQLQLVHRATLGSRDVSWLKRGWRAQMVKADDSEALICFVCICPSDIYFNDVLLYISRLWPLWFWHRVIWSWHYCLTPVDLALPHCSCHKIWFYTWFIPTCVTETLSLCPRSWTRRRFPTSLPHILPLRSLPSFPFPSHPAPSSSQQIAWLKHFVNAQKLVSDKLP